MLLSSVAEAMYWTGRYLERAQAVARTVQVYERLSLDLPGAGSLDLRPLVGREALREPGSPGGTNRLLRALVLDADNPSSVMGALVQARENLRRGRVAAPPEIWTTLNALFVRLSEVDPARMASLIGALDDVVAAGSRMEGVLIASMTRDAAYSFLRIGRHLERADMLLRTMNVLLPIVGPSGSDRIFDDVRWMGLLEAVAAHSMYRRRHHTQVDLPTVLRFLVLESSFPRSVAHGLNAIDEELQKLPKPRQARAAQSVCLHVASALAGTSGTGLGAQFSRVLSSMEEFHDVLKLSYFPDALQHALPLEPTDAEPQPAPPGAEERTHITELDKVVLPG